MQRMVYGVMFKANDVSHTIVCSPLVGIHDRSTIDQHSIKTAQLKRILLAMRVTDASPL